MNKRWWRSQKKLIIWAIAIYLVTVISGVTITRSQSTTDLPSLKVHPLPESLVKWSETNDSNDYFDLIDTTPLGYLVWSQFPIKVYVQQLNTYSNSAADRRFQEWVTAVKSAIAEWNVYLPLQEIDSQEGADILVLRSQPVRKAKLNPDTGLYDIPRAVTAVTHYKFYLQQNSQVIAHKMTVDISPNHTGISLLATIRHELGHALGIWGHSEKEEDALYFSQVSNPPNISARDINTLKKIYQQPTKLGWKIN